MDNSQKKLLYKLGLRVKECRNNKGLTLRELAYSIGKDPQSIHRLEVGGVNPSFIYLSEICKGLVLDLKELLEGVIE